MRSDFGGMKMTIEDRCTFIRGERLSSMDCNATVICNYCSPPTGNSEDNDFSSITALLKALHCGDLLSHSPALYNSKFLGGIFA